MVKIYTDKLWLSWHRILEDQQLEELRSMSKKVWENTMRPVSGFLDRDTTPHEFCLNVTGDDLRWETVGIIISLVSLVAQSLPGKSGVHCIVLVFISMVSHAC